ncbi:MAG TPA: MBL fold metallo-hydrolase [Clostridiaceae bacterium]|jgi:metallo-beta-lactamase family protein|nr:MBL fold metallo-hydrolase [Clostridiaceae bacterium]
MKVTFCGATKTVTGSNFLVEGAGKKFLVDCGLYQGGAKDEIKNEEPFPYDINEIDFMLLTHAHIDHSGRIPKLYKEGYRNPIYATNATCDLCAIMLPDSGHIQETETEWKNRKRIRRGEEELVPIYDAETAAKSLELFKGEPYNQIIELDDDIHVRFNDAGHMLGSSTIEIWIRENGENKKIVFSGDLGNNDIPLLAEPTMIQDADFLVMESTYGNRLHIKNESKAETFINIVTDTIKNGGTVVIPSFAVGRTQEILYELNKIKDSEDDSPEFERKYRLLMNTPVYVDSPLAISATEVFKENMDLFDKETQELIKRGDNPLEFPGLKFTQTVEESKALNESDESAIIISASGMCEVGRIKHHLKHNIWNPKNTILFVGYQAPGTLGRKIVDGAKTVKIFGEEVAVNARVEYIEGYSGHADQAGLLHFVDSFVKKPNHIFLVHGEEESQKVLRDKINENFDLPVSIPDYCESFDLTNTVQATGNIRKRNLDEYRKLEVIDRLETLKEELVDMESIVKEDILANTVNDDEISKLNERIKELEKQIVEIVENK